MKLPTPKIKMPSGSKAQKDNMTTPKQQASSKSETVNYLLLYESMVRHQDLEYDATRDHIALTVQRIRHLGRKSGGININNKRGPTSWNQRGMLLPRGC